MSLPKPERGDRAPGIVEPGALYTANEIKARLQLGDWAWRQMRRDGLPVIRSGKCAYVLADDVISFFRTIRDQKDRSK